MIKSYFVTGTDTNVGKTIIGTALLKAAQQYGYMYTAGYKPVASGVSLLSQKKLCHPDALMLQNSSSVKLLYHEVNPYVFMEPTSPHIVSMHENNPIDFTILSNGLRALEHKANWILIEGAGGWFTPLSDNYTFADWVILEQLPVILVVGIKLGCINHAILTARAIIHSGLNLVGWIANNIIPYDKYRVEYIITLKQLLSAPLLGEVPWLEKEINYSNISQYINFTILES